MKIKKAGKGLFIKEGRNGRLGSIKLLAGKATIDWQYTDPDDELTDNARVFFTIDIPQCPGFYSYQVIPNCCIKVQSSDHQDCSTLSYFIVEGIDKNAK